VAMKIRPIRPFDIVVFHRSRRCDAEEVLLAFARISLQVCQAVLPRYRSRFSKH